MDDLVILCNFWLQKSEVRRNGWRWTDVSCEQKLS